MAPREVKGSPEERETYMAEVFRKFYADPQNAGKDLSIEKANSEFRKKYGSMLRNKKAYQIRAAIKAAAHGHAPPTVKSAKRGAEPLTVPLGDPRIACLVTGTPEQLTWFRGVLQDLTQVGLGGIKIDHSADTYLVVARA